MADFLSAWVPRLARVAELAAPVAQRVEAQLAPETIARSQDVCAELISVILLDRKSVAGALNAVAQYHWVAREPAWQAAFAEPAIRELLDAVAQEGGTAPVTTRRPEGSA